METLLQDLRHAIRMLVKSPGFTLVAVLSLALGVSATTTIFSAIDAILLRPLPYPASDRLVSILNTSQSTPAAVSPSQKQIWFIGEKRTALSSRSK